MISKKADWSLVSIGKILLILIILAVILGFIYSKYGSIGKALKSIFDIGEAEINYRVLNDKAQTGFPSIIRDIDKCIKTEKTDCSCSIDFRSFSFTHAIQTDGKKIYLLNIKDKNEITMADYNFNSLNCLINDNLDIKKLKPKNIIKFDKKIPYIDKYGIFTTAEFTYTKNIYKKGKELCWLTDEIDQDTFNKIKTCQ